MVLRAAISLLLSTFFHARQLEITGHIVKELCNVLSRGSRLRRGELVYRLTEVRPSLDVVRSSCISVPFFHPPRPLSLCSSSLTRSLLPHPQWSLKRTLDPLRPPICTRSPRQALRRTVRDAVWAPAILARRRRCLRAPPPPPPAREGCPVPAADAPLHAGGGLVIGERARRRGGRPESAAAQARGRGCCGEEASAQGGCAAEGVPQPGKDRGAQWQARRAIGKVRAVGLAVGLASVPVGQGPAVRQEESQCAADGKPNLQDP